MINNDYSKAYKEVWEIIKNFPKEELEKIPEDTIKFLKEKMNNDYEFMIDPLIDLSEQTISKEAKSIIIVLFEDYYATEKQKEGIKAILKSNQEKIEEEKLQKYNPDDIFKNIENRKNNINNAEIANTKNQNTNEVENTSLIEYKENFFIKFKNFIMKLLNLKS